MVAQPPAPPEFMEPSLIVRSDLVFYDRMDPRQAEPEGLGPIEVMVCDRAVVRSHVLELAEVQVVARSFGVDRKGPFTRVTVSSGVAEADRSVVTVGNAGGLFGEMRESDRIVERQVDRDQ